MRILFCGDIMPGGVLPYQREYISDDLKKYLDSFGLRIGTLEAAIGTDLPYDQTKTDGRMNIVYARNEDFFRIKEMGFDVVSLANNHVFDLGEEGLKNTIDILKKNNIKYCGAGLNIEEASAPAIIEKDGVRIALLAYCMYGNQYLGYVELAGDNKAGVNPLDIEKVEADIKKYKQQCDYVVVMPHWGREYQYLPMVECKIMAQRMVDVGADAVIASHAHNIQPEIKYKGKSIFFCLSNFLFPDFLMHPPRPIWYPSDDVNIDYIKREVGYPSNIKDPIVSVWTERSRVGMLVDATFKDGKVLCKYKFSYLTKDNKVEFYSKLQSCLKEVRFSWMKLLIQSKYYKQILRIYNSKWNIIRRGWHFGCRLTGLSKFMY